MDDGAAEDDGAFGRAVAARRAELGLTRKEVVLRCGLSYPYLADIESGRKRPSAKAMHVLADALELRPSELLDRAELLAHQARPATAPLPDGEPPAGAAAWRSGPPGTRRSRWFHDDAPDLRRQRGDEEPPSSEVADRAMRSWVRQVVREELGSFASEPDTLAAAIQPSAPMLAPSSLRAESGQPPSLDASILKHLPKWLLVPADSSTDLAIQAVVLERLHHLQPDASRDEVRAEIRAALDGLISRARRRRGPT